MISSKIRCKECNKNKLRLTIRSQRTLYYSPNMKVWKDKDICPPCYNKKKKTPITNELESFEEPIIYWTNRSCRSCNGKIELSRYRNCLICQPTLGDEETGIYGGTSVSLFQEKANFRISELDLIAGG
jgi:hypothetical protein